MSGNKRLVYVMMKILKKCYEDVNITSFKVLEIKFTPFLQNSCGWARQGWMAYEILMTALSPNIDFHI